MAKVTKAPDLGALHAAVKQIETMNHDSGRGLLIEEMTAAGAKIGERPKGSGVIHITHLGITCQTTAGMANGLTVWAQKARRAVLNGGAV
jgi:hypothetical protein